MVYGACLEIEQLAAGHVAWRGAMIGTMGSAAGAGAVAGGAAGPGAGGVVSRPRLVGRLGAQARVSVVSAPPGSGKTVLLRSWISQLGLAGRARRPGSAAILAGGAGRAAGDGGGIGASAGADGGAGPGRVGDHRAAAGG